MSSREEHVTDPLLKRIQQSNDQYYEEEKYTANKQTML